MLTESEAQSVCQRAIELSPAPATEVRLTAERSSLTRLANSNVSQSIHKEQGGISVRALLPSAASPTKAGIASTNRLDEEGLAAVAARAVAVAELQHDDATVLPPVGPQTYQPTDLFDAATADCPPRRRAEPLTAILERCRREGLTCGGAFATAARTRAIASSAGLFALDRRTEARLSLTISRNGASGWDRQLAHRIDEIDPSVLADRAIDLAVRGAAPRPIEPGRYTVVLPPAAVESLLVFLAAGGLTTKAILEGRSFFSGKLGQQVLGENITIADDARAPLAGGLPFDGEGLPRQRVTLVENGVFAHMVHGRETARLANDEPTGHGLTPSSNEGAVPGNAVLSAGSATMEEMIGSVERGLLVTHFHYTNMLRPVDLTITGMTRDGLFLIEGGRVGPAVCNMRFTESLARAFTNVLMIGRESRPVSGLSAGYFVAPALVIEGFNFSSATEF